MKLSQKYIRGSVGKSLGLVDKPRRLNWYSQVKKVLLGKIFRKAKFYKKSVFINILESKMYLTLEGYLINNSKSIHHNFKLPHLILSLVINI